MNLHFNIYFYKLKVESNNMIMQKWKGNFVLPEEKKVSKDSDDLSLLLDDELKNLSDVGAHSFLSMVSRPRASHADEHPFNRNDQRGIYGDSAIGYGLPTGICDSWWC